jgi:3-phosphoshikimate 1-carboxyvinyltransferase
MIAPLLKEGLRLSLTGEVISRPYIEMTMAMMRDFGADATWKDERTIEVASQPYHSMPYTIESDWSAASYWYETVLLSDNEHETATLKGLFEVSLQGDSVVRELFGRLGIQSMPLSQGTREPRICLVRRGAVNERLDCDFTRMPDLVQTLVVACALKGIPFRFTGVQSLRIKETDRIAALQTELAKLGVSLENEGDSVLLWKGPEEQPRARVPYLFPTSGTAIDTYDDHRMAMAFAPAAFVLDSIDINEPEVVSKSYPRFWQDLEQAGFTLEQL